MSVHGFAPKAVSTIRHADGELTEIQRREHALRKRPGQSRPWFGQLRFIGIERDYNPGWAAHKFREKFGSWPNAFRNAPPQSPSSEVRNWVKSRMIAFAKSQGGRRYG